MKHTLSSKRSSREKKRKLYSGRNRNIRSRSPISRNRQRRSNSRDGRQIENRRQVDIDTNDSLDRYNEKPTWNDSRSYASSYSSDHAFPGRQYTRDRNEGNNYQGGYESDTRSFNEVDTNTRTFDGNSRRQDIPGSPVICKFYNNEGRCSRKDSCGYLHLCRHYISGSCKFGRICKRSHNIFDRQPMQLLEQYGMIPDRYTPEDIVRSIKEKLNNGTLKSKRHTISKTNLERPLLQRMSRNVLDTVSDTSSHRYRTGATGVRCEQRRDSLDLYQSDTRQYDEPDQSSQSEVDTSVDYIPLERKTKMKLKRVGKCRKMKVYGDDKETKKNTKKVESQHKMKDCKVEMADGPEEGSDNNVDGQMNPDQSTMKFELQNGYQHFQVRHVSGRFQIAAIPGPWNVMNVTDSEKFSQLYHSAVQIGQRFLPKS